MPSKAQLDDAPDIVNDPADYKLADSETQTVGHIPGEPRTE